MPATAQSDRSAATGYPRQRRRGRRQFRQRVLRADGKRDSDTPLSTIVRHIDYLINIMGDDHVALGSDFDGITLPDDLHDVSGLPRLISALRDSGYDQFVLNKLLWGNWQKVLQNVWQQ